MDDAVTIHRIEPFRALDAAGVVSGIWRDATGSTDENAQSFVTGTYPKHVRWPGFRLYLAAIDGSPIGFVYGYESRPGQWWHDCVAPALQQAGKGEWLSGSIELAEIAVLPQFQGRGVGTRLIDTFLDDADCPVLLAVEGKDERAHVLYAAHGFHDLLTDFTYPGFDDDRIIVMGRPEGGTA